MVGLIGSATVANAGTDRYNGKKKSSKKSKSSASSAGFVGSNSATSGAENGLAGIKIYDSGLRVLALYGNPDSISAISVGGTSDAGGGQGGPPGGVGGRGGGRQGGNGNGGGAAAPSLDSMTPLPSDVLGTGSLWQPTGLNFQGREPQMSGTSAPGAPGGPPPSGGAPPGMGGPGAPGGGGANTANESTTFTRWNYTKNGTKLGFVIDKFNRVLQIEALALENKGIQTRRGVGFGSTFSTVMKRYAPGGNDPDGYDLAGNHFTVRFLTRTRVAFRLTQLAAKTPHVVTGIVVSAGKK